MHLIINPGSTSIKYALFDEKNKKRLFTSIFHKKGKKYKFCIENFSQEITEHDYENHIDFFANFIKKEGISSLFSDITAVGVRVVHGGNFFSKTTEITLKNKEKLRALSPLAPLHNPLSLEIIETLFSKISTKTKIFAVFDTVFHQTIPSYISQYPLPKKISNDLQIQKYGFHGIVCESILRQINENFGKIPKKIILCHLGGGCSITAIKDGKSINTTMGFTPMEGVMMTTRSGTIDSGIFVYLKKNLKISDEKCLDLLNTKSGFFGITGTVNTKEIFENTDKNSDFSLSMEMFVYQVTQEIFAAYGLLEGCDMIIFSGGMGKGSEILRSKICKCLSFLHISLNEEKNKNLEEYSSKIISNSHSSALIQVSEADEEKEIFEHILKELRASQ